MRRPVILVLLYSMLAAFIAVRLDVDRSLPIIIPSLNVHWNSIAMLALAIIIVIVPLLPMDKSLITGRGRSSTRRRGINILALLFIAAYLAALGILVGLFARNRQGVAYQPLNASPGNFSVPITPLISNVSSGSGVEHTEPVELGIPMDRGLILSLLLFSGLVSLAVLTIRALGSSSRPVVEEGEYREEVLEATRETLQAISEGGDPRSAIIYYFAQLCSLLKRKGVNINDGFTAREVARHTLETWPFIPAKPLNRLVKLFEEARYSQHVIPEEYRREALECLDGISTSLEVRISEGGG